MKTQIIYYSSKCSVEEKARELKECLGADVSIHDLKKKTKPNIENFERIIIGGALKSGRLSKKLTEFCIGNSELLSTKELGFYACSREKEVNALKQLINAYPEELLRNAKSIAVFSAGFEAEKMNFLQKLITVRRPKINRSEVKKNHEAVRIFSKRMDKIFNPFLFLS